MRWNGWFVGTLLAGVAVVSLGCTEGGSVSVSVPALPSAFNGGDGYPGPWWRDGGQRIEFDIDLGTCRRRSSEARRGASGNPHDAAYRAFLACMEELAWIRGAPPRPPRAPSG